MFCRKCGADVGKSNFCPNCGTENISVDTPKDKFAQTDTIKQSAPDNSALETQNSTAVKYNKLSACNVFYFIFMSVSIIFAIKSYYTLFYNATMTCDWDYPGIAIIVSAVDFVLFFVFILGRIAAVKSKVLASVLYTVSVISISFIGFLNLAFENKYYESDFLYIAFLTAAMVIVTAVLGKCSKNTSYTKKEKRTVISIYIIVSALVLVTLIIFYLVSTSGARHLTKSVGDLDDAFGNFDKEVATAKNIFEK